MKQKAIELSLDIIATGGSREDSRMLVDAVRTPAITYTVGQSYMGDARMDEIDKASLSRLVAASGYNRNMDNDQDLRGRLDIHSKSSEMGQNNRNRIPQILKVHGQL